MSNNQNNNGASNTSASASTGMKLTAGAFTPSTTSGLKLDSVGFTPQMSTEASGFVPKMSAPSFTPQANYNSFTPAATQNSMPNQYEGSNDFQGQSNYGQQYGQQNFNYNNGNSYGNQPYNNFNNQFNQSNYNNGNNYQQNQGFQGQNNFQQNMNYNQQTYNNFNGGAQGGNQQLYNNQGQYNNFNQGNYNQKPMNAGGQKTYNNFNQNNQGGSYNKNFNQGSAPYTPNSQYKKKEYNNQAFQPKQQYNNNGGNEFNNWQAPPGHMPKMNNGKLANVPTGATKPKPLSLAATPFSFTPFTPVPVDVVADNLKKFEVTDETEVKNFKTYLTDLKKCLDDSSGVISLDLFRKVGELKLCQLDVGITKSCNSTYVKRQPEMLEQTFKQQKGGKYNKRPPGGNNQNNGDDFQKGTANQYNNKKQNNSYSPWIQADTEEKRELAKKAKETIDRMRSGTKNDLQKIRLILNVIAPDNKEKKFGELRQHLFKGLKTPEECEQEGIEYIESEHKLIEGTNSIDEEILESIVSNIIRKAQVEKEYCIFYGELCEKKITLELQLRGDIVKISNMKNSLFRKQLFNVCKICFEKFFDDEEREKSKANLEATLKFQQKLFGNIEFVGELYRRKILPQSTLISVFESLLGMSEVNDKIDDFIMEGAVNLMNKVGENFESNVKNTKKNYEETKKLFDKIINRFKWAMNLEDEEQIQNRTKLLIKNMFQNKDEGWAKTKEMHKGGPKTKKEVQKEVEDKYRSEQQARNNRDGNRGGGYNDHHRNDRNDDRNDRNDRNDNRNRRGEGKQQYQKKETGGGGSYGNGGRENRDGPKNNDKKGNNKKSEAVKEIVALDDDHMGDLLKKNFETYALKKKMADEGNMEEEEGEENKQKEITPDLSLYEKFKTENGKAPSTILFSLLTKIFDEDMQKVDNYFASYLDAIINKKIFITRDFGEGISKFVQFMPEIVLDVPQIHQYLWKHVINPLNRKGQLKMRFIKWVADPKDKPVAEDEDDMMFDESNAMYKLMALILIDQKKGDKAPSSWDEVFKFFDDCKWGKVVSDKLEKIDDPDLLWPEIKEEIGNEMASVIIPLLQGKTDEAKKAVK